MSEPTDDSREYWKGRHDEAAIVRKESNELVRDLISKLREGARPTPSEPCTNSHPKSENQPDKRLKIVEVIISLGGVLGIIISLEQNLLAADAKATSSSLLAVLIVLFIFFAFFAFSALYIPLPETRINVFLRGLSATFSGLLALELATPFTYESTGIFVYAISYLGVIGAVILYIVIVLVFAFVLYYALMRGMNAVWRYTAP